MQNELLDMLIKHEIVDDDTIPRIRKLNHIKSLVENIANHDEEKLFQEIADLKGSIYSDIGHAIITQLIGEKD